MAIYEYLGFNPKKDLIKITCNGADSLPIDRIVEFQGNLKKLSTSNRDKLIKSIMKEGFMAPVFLWEDAGDYRLLDGTQRTRTLLFMREKGWNIPMIPVVYINANSEREAKRKLLKITSQYGKLDMSSLGDWVSDINEDIMDSINLIDGSSIQIDFKPEIDTVGEQWEDLVNKPIKHEESVNTGNSPTGLGVFAREQPGDDPQPQHHSRFNMPDSESFKPVLDPQQSSKMASGIDIDRAETRIGKIFASPENRKRICMCPECGAEFEITGE